MKHTYRNRHISLPLVALGVIIPLLGCRLSFGNDNVVKQSTYLETYRPQLQYTPSQNWMNDPNGLVYYEGEYHLFYQYNPNGDGWGYMSWGHAVSTDLVHWDELPIALPVKKDADGNVIEMFFSGSAVMDINNTSGLGQTNAPAMVAMYTSNYPNTTTLENGKTVPAGTQAQSIAYSTDKGRTWTTYENNPVLALPPSGYEDQYREFRDPKIFWYEPKQKWIMVAALPTQHKAILYESDNMLDWSFMSEFGPSNAINGLWECPDLFEMAVDGNKENKKWVMVININSGSPAGGSGSQYFIGQFNGTTFTADSESLHSNDAPAGSLIADFEDSSYSTLGWSSTDDLTDAFLATGNLSGQTDVNGYQGSQLVNTFVGGNSATGMITSPSFTITDNYINLMVGGGNHPYGSEGATAVVLMVDGEAVRTATGKDSETLNWTNWNISDYLGKQASIAIIDDNHSDWGHILVDHIVQSEKPKPIANWSDYGSDFYAAASWNGVPDGKRLWIGWMSNWDYAGKIPTSPWRSAQTFVRELSLKTINGKVVLSQEPTQHFSDLRATPLFQRENPIQIASSRSLLTDNNVHAAVYEINAQIETTTADSVGFKLRTGDNGDITLVGYDALTGEVFIDRTSSGDSRFSNSFAAKHTAPLIAKVDVIDFKIIVDTASVTVFANDGEVVLTDQIFPAIESDGIEVYAEGGTATAVINSLTIWPLESIWVDK